MGDRPDAFFVPQRRLTPTLYYYEEILNQTAQLDTVLAEICARWSIPGLGVGIVKNGEIIYARGFGVQSLETGAPVTPDSIFCVASITKCFVACAVMQLAEQGKVDLDAPLVTYLPEFRLTDDRFRLITLRQMLSHTSGMPDMDDAEYEELVANPEYDEGAAGRYVQALKNRMLIASPGERFAYSNIAYAVLGYLISKVSGQIFENYMKSHVLLPAGMHGSTLYFPEVMRDRLAVPHLRIPGMAVNPVYPYHRADAPASFLHSSVIEMCRWCITCLNRGEYNGKRILSPESYDQMWKPAAEWGYPPFYEHIGLGWTLGHFDGYLTASHGGMGFGWTDFLTLLPEKQMGAIVLCNEESSARSRVVRAVVQTILGREPTTGTVSWMVPVSQALQTGGIQAASDCYLRIKEDPNYSIDADDLLDLAYQIASVRKWGLARDVLEFNLQVFPDHLDSSLMLTRMYLQIGDHATARRILEQILVRNPTNAAAASLLIQVNQNTSSEQQ